MTETVSWEKLKKKAAILGFDAAGVVPLEKLPEEGGRLGRWLEAGYQAGMNYMERNVEKRVDAALLVENARSVIVTLTNYYSTDRQPAGIPRIARYAYGKDYHIVIRERLRRLQGEMGGRCFVDSAPVFEHEWARRAGLGWIGKNTLLLHRELGSFCFIGVIITPALFDHYSLPLEKSYCGTCTRCIDACPTGALSEHCVDARRCISYQTIENRGEFPEELKKRAGGRIFGCDICQEVCPWNRKVQPHQVPEFIPHPGAMGLTAEQWRNLGEADFMELFKDTPLERTGLEKIKRNL